MITCATLSPADHVALTQLYAQAAHLADAGRWVQWAELFTEDCLYLLQPRENFDRGFPLATMRFESRGMLLDRAYAVTQTIFHDPYYQRHVVGAPCVSAFEEGRIHCEANYAVFRTKLNQETTVFNTGRYLDEVVQTPQGWKFAVRKAVYDSEMIPNSIIYPI
ncbi:MAG: aromatic-ring-hydroxylating dioxygenase subunit beta [Betaproteobacteria bacterium]|nr:aromatic-ring-hydroxylating dioxygenase subunit beta [Betaproteobacteria bacterium]